MTPSRLQALQEQVNVAVSNILAANESNENAIANSFRNFALDNAAPIRHRRRAQTASTMQRAGGRPTFTTRVTVVERGTTKLDGNALARKWQQAQDNGCEYSAAKELNR